MADEHNNPNSRMLFTDFNVSPKGRPAPGAPMSGFVTPLTSITDLASTLELDFEDDVDNEEYPFEKKEKKKEEKKQDDAEGSASDREEAKAVRSPPPEDDPEINLEPTPKMTQFDTEVLEALVDTGGREVPTWEEFTQTFRRGPGQMQNPKQSITGDILADGQKTSSFDIGVDGDVLSSLGMIGSAEHDDNDAGATQLLSKEDLGRVYGLEDLENFITRGGEMRDESRENDKSSPTRRFERSASPPEADRSGPPVSTDTQAALFSDLDIESVWQSRIAGHQEGDTGVYRSSGTRSLNMFDDVDLELLWLEKRGTTHDGDPSDTVMLHDGRDAGSTVIMSPEQLYSSKTRRLVKDEAGKSAEEEPEHDFLAELDSFISAAALEERQADEELSIENVPAAGGSYEDFQPETWPESSDADAVSHAAVAPPSVADTDIREILMMSDEPFVEEDDPDDSSAMADTLLLRPEADSGGDREAASALRPKKSRKLGRPFADMDMGERKKAVRAARSAGGGDDGDYDPFEGDVTETSYDPLAGIEVNEIEDESLEEYLPGSSSPGMTTDDLINDINFDDAVNSEVSAPVIDDSAIARVSGPRPGTEEMQAIMGEYDNDVPADARDKAGDDEDDDDEDDDNERYGGSEGDEAEEDSEPADSVAVNPMDVFANMDDMDFSDDVDDEMRAMLDEDGEDEAGGVNIDVDGFNIGEMPAAPPSGVWGLFKYYAVKVAYRVLPMALLQKIQAMIAWRENWWFYCDLVAAIIASASLAVILSYYFWYKN